MQYYGLIIILAIIGLATYIAGYDGIGIIMLSMIVLILMSLGLFMFVREHRLNVDLLMTVVGLVLIYHRIVFEGLIIYVLYGFAEVLEEWITRFAARSLEKAQRLIPRRVYVEYSSGVREVDVDRVRPGDIIVVRRGEVVPVDGILLSNGVFDTSMVTGESLPVELPSGSIVESGYINIGGITRVKASKSPSESTLQVIVSKSLELLEVKGRTQRIIDRITPILIGFIVLVFTPAYLLLGPERSIPILLAGCPSAYIVTSASSTAYTIGLLARRRVIAKGGRALEAAANACTLVIDKTGTVTLGHPKPYHVKAPPGYNVELVKKLISATASISLHPVSRAIVASWGVNGGIEWGREIPGLGVESRVNGYTILLGSRSLLESRDINPPEPLECSADDIVVYYSINNTPGYICLSEELDEESIHAIGLLKSMGYRIVLASGDRSDRVRSIAMRLGIDDYYHSMKPKDKTRLVMDLKDRCGVAMIGDGINDIEAMAASDLGVAVGNIDAVNAVADAVLLRGVGSIIDLFRSSRTYVRGLLLGFLIASIIKLSVITLGLFGSIPLWMAALFGDDGSTIISSTLSIFMIKYARTS